MTLKNLLILLVVINISLALWQFGRIQLTTVDAPLPSVALVGEKAADSGHNNPTTPANAAKTSVPATQQAPKDKQPVVIAAKTTAKTAINQPEPTKTALSGTTTDKPKTPAKPAVNTALVCSQYGPFTDKNKAQQTAKKLTVQKAKVKLTNIKEKLKTGSAVQLVALDEIDFSQLERDLATFDIKDWSVVRREGERFIISVGVFSSTEHLEARLAQIAYLDRDPLIVDFHKTVTQYQLVAKTQGQPTLTPKGKIIPCK